MSIATFSPPLNAKVGDVWVLVVAIEGTTDNEDAWYHTVEQGEFRMRRRHELTEVSQGIFSAMTAPA